MRKVSLMLMLAGLMMAASCGNQNPTTEENQNELQQPVTQVEQVQQPQVQRVAFVPTTNTPDFVDAAERSVDAVVHIMTKVVKQSNTYEDFFGALLNITPVEGDKIVSQDQGFAIFNGSSWEGTLSTLESGKGYVYIRMVSGN